MRTHKRKLILAPKKGLPPKIETTINCPLSEMQTFWYKRLLLREWDLGRDLGPFGAICRDADVMRYIDDG